MVNILEYTFTDEISPQICIADDFLTFTLRTAAADREYMKEVEVQHFKNQRWL